MFKILKTLELLSITHEYFEFDFQTKAESW